MSEKPKSVLKVEIELDGVPGWGFFSEDHVKFLQQTLDSMIPHYHPKVSLIEGRTMAAALEEE